MCCLSLWAEFLTAVRLTDEGPLFAAKKTEEGKGGGGGTVVLGELGTKELPVQRRWSSRDPPTISLMSPVHRSSSSVVAAAGASSLSGSGSGSGTTSRQDMESYIIGIFESLEREGGGGGSGGGGHGMRGGGEEEEGGGGGGGQQQLRLDSESDGGLQRSTSLPPSMLTGHHQRRERQRVCVRPSRGSGGGAWVQRHHHSRSRMPGGHDTIVSLETREEGGEGEEEEEEEEGRGGGGGGGGENEGSGMRQERASTLDQIATRHHRRQAFRDRGGRRVHSIEDPTLLHVPQSSGGASNISGEDGGTSTATAVIAFDEDSESTSEKAQRKLLELGHIGLMRLVSKMPLEVQQQIVSDTLPPSFYEMLASRSTELSRGHLATGNADSSKGAVHWFFEEGTLHRLVGWLVG